MDVGLHQGTKWLQLRGHAETEEEEEMQEVQAKGPIVLQPGNVRSVVRGNQGWGCYLETRDTTESTLRRTTISSPVEHNEPKSNRETRLKMAGDRMYRPNDSIVGSHGTETLPMEGILFSTEIEISPRD